MPLKFVFGGENQRGSHLTKHILRLIHPISRNSGSTGQGPCDTSTIHLDTLAVDQTACHTSAPPLASTSEHPATICRSSLGGAAAGYRRVDGIAVSPRAPLLGRERSLYQYASLGRMRSSGVVADMNSARRTSQGGRV